MSVLEGLAIILVTVLICTPLAIGAVGAHGGDFGDWVGGLTLAVLAFQALIFKRQAEVMENQADIFRRQETMLIEQAGALIEQTKLSEKQATLAHQTYLQTNRPRLRVRNITLSPGCTWVMGQVVSGQFYVENVGGTNATIVESYCGVVWGLGGLPMKRPYEGHTNGFEINNPVEKERVIKSGVSTVGIFSSSQTYDTRNPPQPGPNSRGFVMGWIDYKDDNGIRRRMAFCREYVTLDGAGRFISVHDPDYEHEG